MSWATDLFKVDIHRSATGTDYPGGNGNSWASSVVPPKGGDIWHRSQRVVDNSVIPGLS